MQFLAETKRRWHGRSSCSPCHRLCFFRSCRILRPDKETGCWPRCDAQAEQPGAELPGGKSHKLECRERHEANVRHTQDWRQDVFF